MCFAELGQSNHWYIQVLWLGTGLLGELTSSLPVVLWFPLVSVRTRVGVAIWAGQLTATSLSMSVDLVWVC